MGEAKWMPSCLEYVRGVVKVSQEPKSAHNHRYILSLLSSATEHVLWKANDPVGAIT
jgi:hypothetical protein